MEFSTSSYSSMYEDRIRHRSEKQKAEVTFTVKRKTYFSNIKSRYNFEQSSSTEDDEQAQDFTYYYRPKTRLSEDLRTELEQDRKEVVEAADAPSPEPVPTKINVNHQIIIDYQLRTKEQLIAEAFEINKDSSYEYSRNIAEEKQRKKYEGRLKVQSRNLPWHMPRTESLRKTPFYKRFSSYQKVMLQLPYNFSNYKKILHYYEHGINIFKIDLKYGDEKIHNETLKAIEKARKFLNASTNGQCVITVGFELTSRKISTGLIATGRESVLIDRDSEVVITANRSFSYRCNHKIIYINFKNYINHLEINDIIRIDSGIVLKILYKKKKKLLCKALTEGLLVTDAAVYLPKERTLLELTITDEEKADTHLAMQCGVDFLVCTCFHRRDLFEYIHWEMAAHKKDVLLIAKVDITNEIKKSQIDSIIQCHHAIYVTGINQVVEELYLSSLETEDGKVRHHEAHQMYLYISEQCTKLRKILIRSPTANIIYLRDDAAKWQYVLYADCIVLRASTTEEHGDPTNFRAIKKTLFPDGNIKMLKLSGKRLLKTGNPVDNILIRYIIVDALLYKVSCIVIINNSGNTVFDIAYCRPLVPIVACFSDVVVARSVTLFMNVHSLTYGAEHETWQRELTERLLVASEYAKKRDFIISGEPYMVVFDSIRGLKRSDSYKIVTLQ